MSLPALPVTADTRSITERVNVLIRDYNTLLGVPAGCIMPYAGATAPDGWLLCHGQAVSRTTYADLFARHRHGLWTGRRIDDLRPARSARPGRGRPRRHGRHRRRPPGRRRRQPHDPGRRGWSGDPYAQHRRNAGTQPWLNDPGHSHQFLHGGSTPAAFTGRAGDGDGLNNYFQGTTGAGHWHLHPERRKRRRAQQHAADPHPQLRDRDMIPLRQPVRRSLGEGGGFGGQAPCTALAQRTCPPKLRRSVGG